MSKETKRNRIYRKIWSDHYGPIPKDAHGRSYEIHHINGDHNDNRLENLKLVTIEEHYEIHLSQEDYNACFYIAQRMRLSPEEISKISSIMAKKSHELQKSLDPVGYSARQSKAAAATKGIKRTPETRAKISASRKGTKASPETRAKMSASRTGKVQSQETIAKKSASLKAYHQKRQSNETV